MGRGPQQPAGDRRALRPSGPCHWAIYLSGERINRLFVRAWRKWSRVSDVLSDTIPGIRVVKAFN
jgi:hypothetical protein